MSTTTLAHGKLLYFEKEKTNEKGKQCNLTLSKFAYPRCRCHRQGVRADTRSLKSLTTWTRCQRSHWLCGHDNDYVAGLGIHSSVFWANRWFFAKKERMSNSLKKNKRFAHLLIFGELPERFAHGRSFLVSDLSNLLTLLIFGEWPERFAHIAPQKWGNEQIAHF